MGIGKTQAQSLIDAVKAGTTTKTEMRAQLGDAINVIYSMTAALDAQLNAAPVTFAAANAAAFEAHVDALPVPTIEIPPDPDPKS